MLILFCQSLHTILRIIPDITYTYPAVEAQRTRDELDALRAKRKAVGTEE